VLLNLQHKYGTGCMQSINKRKNKSATTRSLPRPTEAGNEGFFFWGFAMVDGSLTLILVRPRDHAFE